MSGQEEKTVIQREGFGGGQLILAALGGAVAGAIAGVLFAPRAGAETREKLGDLASQAKEKAKHLPEAFSRARTEIGEAYVDALDSGVSSRSDA